jgi:hypothetical protein
MSSINTAAKARPPVSQETNAHSVRPIEVRARKVASTLSSMGEQLNDQESTSSIAELKTRKAALCLEMESAAQAFIKATQTFAEGEIRRSVEQAVTSQYELSRRLGEGGLHPLKLELDQLIGERSPEAIQSRLNHDGLWPHRSDNFNHANVTYSHYRTSTVSPLPVELSRAIGEILKQTAEVLLKKHGFAFVPSGQVQSEEMMAAFRRYSELYFQGAECERDLRCAEVEEGKAEAKRLWDAA